MIRTFYGLEYNPFEKDNAIKFIHESGDFKDATGRLEYCIKTKGIGLFTGGSGAGKTYTIREFVNKLNPNLYKVIYINSSTLTVQEFYRAICFSLGLEPPHKKVDMFKLIQETIINLYKVKKTPLVLILDEAQYLKPTMLNDIPLLLNFEYDSKNYCSLFLVGLPQLASILERNVYESLRQRIIINYSFIGLNKSEINEYIEKSLHKAGCDNPIFEKSAIEAISSYSNGSFRRLNSLLNKCLIVGMSMNKSIINTEVVLASQNDIGGIG
jgi:type II secretory pathway predicted ATPase ExeA